MFYRFNAHREGRAADGRGKDKHAAMDKAARRIASGILKVQRRWAELMKKWADRLSVKWLRILVIVNLCAASYFFLSLIMPGLGITARFSQEGLRSLSPVEEHQADAAGGRGDTLRKQLPEVSTGIRKY